MPDRPLLLLGPPTEFRRLLKNPARPGRAVHRPSRRRQVSRIEPSIANLENMMNQRLVELRDDPSGAEPEEVLVLETVGTVNEFFRALKNLDGFEWMGDFDVPDLEPDDDFFIEDRVGASLGGRVYLIMSNQAGLRELQRLWSAYKVNLDDDDYKPKYDRGYARWRSLFEQLRTIRSWEPRDRIDQTGLVEDWQARLDEGSEIVPVEIELWWRSESSARGAAQSAVSEQITNAEGEVIDSAIIPEIRYHAILARLPISAVEQLVHNHDTELVRTRQVMFFRPSGQTAISSEGFEPVTGAISGADVEITGTPVVALFDGLPVEGHQWLRDYLRVDDPDGWAAESPATNRLHGTAMASMIIRGDMGDGSTPLSRPLYVRPILKPNPLDFNTPKEEFIPEDVLPLDLVHRAVRRMVEGEGEDPPTAPDVKIVNLSVGDRVRLLDRYPSPWARLLDYLAVRYRLLFIVSAGNHVKNLHLNLSNAEFGTYAPGDDRLRVETLKTVDRMALDNGIRSPAEAINVLTVAALNEDSSSAPSPNPNAINPLDGRRSPSDLPPGPFPLIISVLRLTVAEA